jgi:putative redox protein
MRTVQVSWDASAGRFVARGSHAAHQIVINAPRAPSESRGSTGFSATELLLAGAGACSAWDVVEMLRKRRHEVASLEVAVEGQQAADPPWAYERVTLHFRILGRGLRPRVLERVVRLSCLNYCSVLATVGGVAEVAATIEILDESGTSGGRRPVSLAEPPSARAAGTAPARIESAAAPAADED